MSHDDLDATTRAPDVAAADPDVAADDPDVAAVGPDTDDAARDALPPVVDWSRTARRMRTMVLGIGGVVITAWLAIGLLGTGLSWSLLGELAGFGLFAVFASEVVIVGGSALAGMLRAGERGDRLSGNDVSLLPPQLTRRRRR